MFVEGRLETRVPLTSRTGTKEAGEVWVSLRCEGGPSAAGGMGAGAAGAGVEVGVDGGLAGPTAGALNKAGLHSHLPSPSSAHLPCHLPQPSPTQPNPRPLTGSWLLGERTAVN